MGTSAAETVKEIEELRERLQSDVETLEERLPAPALLAKRILGVAAGGGVAAAGLWFLVRKMRGRKKEDAPASAAVIQVLPGDLGKVLRERLDDERLKRWALAAAGTWLVFRLAELRQLRRLSRAG